MPPAILDSAHPYSHTPDTVSSSRAAEPPRAPTRCCWEPLQIRSSDTATAPLSIHAGSYRFPGRGSDPSASISDSGSSSICVSPCVTLTPTTPGFLKVALFHSLRASRSRLRDSRGERAGMMCFGSRLCFSIPRTRPKDRARRHRQHAHYRDPSTEHSQRTVTSVSTSVSAARVISISASSSVMSSCQRRAPALAASPSRTRTRHRPRPSAFSLSSWLSLLEMSVRYACLPLVSIHRAAGFAHWSRKGGLLGVLARRFVMRLSYERLTAIDVRIRNQRVYCCFCTSKLECSGYLMWKIKISILATRNRVRLRQDRHRASTRVCLQPLGYSSR
jgi:hypothetical protein